MEQGYMRFVLLPFVLLALAGCRPASDDLVVGAAASLSGLLPELVDGFRAAHPDIPVTTTLGSSGQLASQIRQGAPIGILLAADAGWVDTLVAAGRVEPDARAVYARGRLAIWSRDARPEFGRIEDLARPEFARIAIANPDFAPYGRAAVQALENAGILSDVQPRFAIAGNVRQALQYAETGNAAAVLVAYALVIDMPGQTLVVPETLHDPLDQALGIISGRQAAAGRLFTDFVLGAKGRAILVRHGLSAPPASETT
jgi:molybdate transport system substrate-binding protein